MNESQKIWLLLTHDLYGLPAAIEAIEKLGLRHFYPQRAARPSPVAGRADLQGDLFPGYLFVEVPQETDLSASLEGLPGILRVIRNEFGRPRSLSSGSITQLERYCQLTGGQEPPAEMQPLDLLAEGERMEYFLGTAHNWQ